MKNFLEKAIMLLCIIFIPFIINNQRKEINNGKVI